MSGWIENIQLPPHNIDAEKSVISAIFLDNEVIYICDSFNLIPDDFYNNEHKSIYKAIKELQIGHKNIDTITVSDTLDKMWVLENIWGIDYIIEITNYVFTTTGISEHAQIVKEKSTLRSILKVCQKISGEVYDQKETIEIIDSIEKKIFDLTQNSIWHSLVHIKDILDGRVEDYVQMIDDPEFLNKNKVLSGYQWLDDMVTGFKAWELTILAARPSMWKTAFALNLMINIAIDQKKPVAFFSLEMTSQSLVDRLLSTIANIPMHKISKWNLDQDDFAKMWDAIEQLSQSDIFIDDCGSLTIWELKSKLRRLKIEKWSIWLVVIDYLQLMSGSGFKYEWNRVQEISQISRWLKELTKELTTPIVALSQLSRNVESRIDKKPWLADLRESWAIEQDADIVMMLHREDYYDPDTDKKWIMDVLVRKNRNGPTGEVELWRRAVTMKYEEINRWDKKNIFWPQSQDKTYFQKKKPEQKHNKEASEDELF